MPELVQPTPIEAPPEPREVEKDRQIDEVVRILAKGHPAWSLTNAQYRAKHVPRVRE